MEGGAGDGGARGAVAGGGKSVGELLRQRGEDGLLRHQERGVAGGSGVGLRRRLSYN